MCNCCQAGCDCGHAIASAIYQSQRVALLCAAAAVAACLLVTLLITGGVGVGVGYHYCVVESKSYELDLQAFRNKYTSSSKATSPSGVRSNSISDGSKTDDTDNTRRKGNIADSIEDTTVDNTVTTVDLSILPRGSESNEADQSHTLGVESEIIDGEKQLQPRIEEKKLRDQSLVDARSLDDEDQQEQLAQKVERHRRKNNALKDFKQTTRVYKDNSDVQLYTQKQNINKNLRYMNRTQFKQQGLYSKQLYNKFNELQKLKSLLLPKLGLNNVINYS